MKDAYYFPHDSNARHDPKILAMRSIYGAAGYGWFWIIVEMLREQAGYRLPLDKYTGNALAMQMQCTPDEARKFVEDCINEFHLFSSDGEYFWSDSLCRRMEKYDERATKARQAALVRWGKGGKKQGDEDAEARPEGAGCKRNANAMRTQCDGNASKVKESKVNESTVPPPPLTPPPPCGASDGAAQVSGEDDVLPDDPAKPVVQFCVENFILTPSPYQVERLVSWLHEGLEPDLIIWAMQQALLNGERKLSYVEGILARCKNEGLLTREAAERAEIERRRARDRPRYIDRSGEIEPPEDVQAKIDPTIPEHLLRRPADSA